MDKAQAVFEKIAKKKKLSKPFIGPAGGGGIGAVVGGGGGYRGIFRISKNATFGYV